MISEIFVSSSPHCFLISHVPTITVTPLSKFIRYVVNGTDKKYMVETVGLEPVTFHTRHGTGNDALLD